MAEVSIAGPQVETKDQRYRRKHRKELRERLYKWRRANPEKLKEINRRSYQKHREERRERIRKDRQENPEKYREYDQRKYQKSGLIQRRKYYQKHHEECIIAVTNRKNLKKTYGPGITVEQWRDLCERFNNRCAYCGVHEEVLQILYNQKLTRDHVIPLSKGGEHSIENIVPACHECNDKKGTKLWPR